ncbi:DNA topoisomerase 2-alpha-like isoform X3 [Paramacrobiotus metropolitanus]|uniref:DNA topoisomerase 2-alpha-like isoform X3 n=1 Tax=Paramacrobiotus metropolitanus TaxID=2943436 RepID=UPI002445DA61|nr:DNA topoisomerase 2-alpha-like isoform X3 [Paramacrobiotus metropolitanus]
MSSEEDEYVPGGSGSPKKTKATKKKKAAASSEDEGDTDNQPTKMARTPKEKKAIKKIYQKKSQLEHILIRPDTYIGSTELVSQKMWVYDTEEKKMVFREIKFVPGLYKIFDEILVNAADNKQRDPKMSMIKVGIDAEQNQISVWNNGHGIPVVEHKEEKMLVPTMIFGHLLTWSNYDDDEKKVTGGRNGYGAKLCNIFSNRFVVETASKEYKKKFKQEWSKNMGKAGEPKVDSFSGEDYTKVTFEPDLSKFKMAVLEKDTVDLLSRRAYDVAGTSGGVKVYLKGEKLPISNFKQYVELYTANNSDEMGNPLKVVTEKANERWEFAVTSSDTGFSQVSFVNSIATTKGGRHVEYITDQITKAMNEVIKEKNKSGAEIKPFQAIKGNVRECFYSLPELEEWKANLTESELKKYKIKYYKGLGTSTSEEAKEYFTNITRHRIAFRYGGKDDDDAVDLAFAKNKADARKDWLTKGMEERKQRRLEGLGEVYLYTKTTKSVTFRKFVDEELILFSNMDNERSIASLVDGLKPGQRKVLFTCFTRKKKGEAKVAQLVGSVAEKSAYHHGESLMSTIVGLAQNFVGSNNINLLLPLGQFGTRLLGGKDAASARYIFTNLSHMARAVFHPHDDPLLNYLNEDNQKIEPEWYIPVVPMVSMNGAEGIGTGWMTKIPNYNPLDIVANLRALIRGDEIKPTKPWYKGYHGEILPVDSTRYLTNGEVAVHDQENSIEITELPIRTWTQNYKEVVVEPLLLGSESKDGKGKPPQIQDYKEYHTDTTVRFVIRMSGQKFVEFQREGFHKTFKLQQTISMSSMVLFDSNGVIRKYDNVSDILREFFEVRMTFYGKRKDFLVARLSAEALNLENQARFIDEKINGKITIENVKKKDFINKLKKAQPPYDSDPAKTWKKKFGLPEYETPTADDDDVKKKTDEAEAGSDFDYILKMPLWSLTNERFMDLIERRDDENKELSALRMKTPSDLYTGDLDEFESRLEKVEAEEAFVSPTKKPAGRVAARAKGQKGRGAVASYADTLPSVYGTRVEPVVDTATIAKFEKAKELKDRKVDGIKVPRARAKKPAENGENPASSEAPSSNRPAGDDSRRVDTKRRRIHITLEISRAGQPFKGILLCFFLLWMLNFAVGSLPMLPTDTCAIRNDTCPLPGKNYYVPNVSDPKATIVERVAWYFFGFFTGLIVMYFCILFSSKVEENVTANGRISKRENGRGSDQNAILASRAQRALEEYAESQEMPFEPTCPYCNYLCDEDLSTIHRRTVTVENTRDYGFGFNCKKFPGTDGTKWIVISDVMDMQIAVYKGDFIREINKISTQEPNQRSALKELFKKTGKAFSVTLVLEYRHDLSPHIDASSGGFSG